MGSSSEHFRDSELRCPCCHVNGCTPELVAALELYRREVGPVSIDSAYRCAAHNKAVGGAPNSQHLFGNAADIRVAGMTAIQLFNAAKWIKAFTGFGRSDSAGFLHVDLGTTDAVRGIYRPAKWCYDKAGKQISWTLPAST